MSVVTREGLHAICIFEYVKRHFTLVLIFFTVAVVSTTVSPLIYLFIYFAFPSYISGDHHFWVRFLRM